ncbi:hypothetical protein [Rhizobium tumorigenes]|uniref:hypothetical protein n=1 Tax=Rhizobium tumorigenes TaxID=2041385 RepID=UPI00241E06F5|nr:hypothetical protein [Rhizobium tumorigenes]WFS04655.1 hypothetical protein PR016_28080 [Rhizobium tumorigenes]
MDELRTDGRIRGRWQGAIDEDQQRRAVKACERIFNRRRAEILFGERQDDIRLLEPHCSPSRQAPAGGVIDITEQGAFSLMLAHFRKRVGKGQGKQSP